MVAAAVIIPKRFSHPYLQDSKRLTAVQRQEARDFIQQKAIAYAVAAVSHIEIDRLNILRASITAMHRALDKLDVDPEHILVDGNQFYPYRDKRFTCIVEGDGKYKPIAAASILAKTHRDDLMERLHATYPEYDWASNKGYPTAEHRAAIGAFGSSPLHRKSFQLLPAEQFELF